MSLQNVNNAMANPTMTMHKCYAMAAAAGTYLPKRQEMKMETAVLHFLQSYAQILRIISIAAAPDDDDDVGDCWKSKNEKSSYYLFIRTFQ